jgi:hypothetical protein
VCGLNSGNGTSWCARHELVEGSPGSKEKISSGLPQYAQLMLKTWLDGAKWGPLPGRSNSARRSWISPGWQEITRSSRGMSNEFRRRIEEGAWTSCGGIGRASAIQIRDRQKPLQWITPSDPPREGRLSREVPALDNARKTSPKPLARRGARPGRDASFVLLSTPDENWLFRHFGAGPGREHSSIEMF